MTDPTPPTAPLARPLLGAYAMAPTDPDERTAFYAGVAHLDVGGLEVPVLGADTPQMQPAWFAQVLRPDWDLLLTCIPTVMARLGTTPGYGLASTDEASRAAALADVATARDLALRLADRHGRALVAAVQVHSAPGPRLGSADTLARSLEILAGWDWAGARVLVEHCDALVPGRAASKGFLTLEAELEALARVGAPAGAGTRLGASVNWGRSAIEGRSARTPLAHVAAARDAGVLDAVVLSGTSGTDTAWGPAWADAHIPPSGGGPLAASAGSLLDAATAGSVLEAAGPDVLRAVKVAVRPVDADVPTRLAVARASLDLARHEARP